VKARNRFSQPASSMQNPVNMYSAEYEK